VNDLVAEVGGHPNTTRHHLRALVTAGLVAVERTASAGGRGRPATRYAATRAGRDAVTPDGGGAASEEYVALAGAFAQRLAERDGDPGSDARAIGRAWGEGLALGHSGADGDSAEAPSERVVALLDRLGFSPDTEPGDGPVGVGGTTVLLRTCPLLDAARRHPEVVCQVHLGLVSGALAAFDASADGVGLVPFARPGACVLTLPGTLVG
jgi:predicted ArsR family transcriptional regulator